VYTCACFAFASSQLPFAALPVKSMSRTSGPQRELLRDVVARVVRDRA
jgi:hypothetical protein